jgi:DNA invertase Pin-like site-specific DNA recombinase
VSRADQRRELQEDETAEVVKRRGWTHELGFADHGASGADDKRPEFRRMMDAARRREFDVLVVWRADRVYRSLVELVQTIRELGELGIGFVSVTEPFDTTTSSGRLLLSICGAFAEFERNVLIERTRAGLEAAKRRGRKLGRPRKVIDVERARAMKNAGMTFAQVAKVLGVSVGVVHAALATGSNRKQPEDDSSPRSA